VSIRALQVGLRHQGCDGGGVGIRQPQPQQRFRNEGLQPVERDGRFGQDGTPGLERRGLDSIAFSRGADNGSREKNTSKQKPEPNFDLIAARYFYNIMLNLDDGDC
jgi:hypothetical protein